MPRSSSIEIGCPGDYPELLAELKTRIRTAQVRAAVAVEGFGPCNLGSLRSLAEAWQEPDIWQWLIAKLPWGQTMRLLARVKGRSTRDWYLSCAWLEQGWSHTVQVPRIAARKEADSGENS